MIDTLKVFLKLLHFCDYILQMSGFLKVPSINHLIIQTYERGHQECGTF